VMGPELTMRVTAANSICWASIKTSASNSKMKPALRSPKMVPVLPHPGANWHEVVEARDPARAEEILAHIPSNAVARSSKPLAETEREAQRRRRYTSNASAKNAERR
jgi:hypothetical protein